jgi:hypothetical protein
VAQVEGSNQTMACSGYVMPKLGAFAAENIFLKNNSRTEKVNWQQKVRG